MSVNTYMKGYRLKVTGSRVREKAQPFRAPARGASLQPFNQGFTLIEMLVAVSIFTIVMTTAIGTLIVMLTAGSVAQSAQSLTMNLSFAVDSMARNIRTGFDYHCSNTVAASGAALTMNRANCTTGATVLVLTEGRTGYRVAYRYDAASDALYQKTDIPSGEPGGPDYGTWVRLTSEDIKVEPFEFTVDGSDPAANDTVQPMVRMTLTALPADSRTQIYPYYIQTTVTSKYLDI